VLSRLRPRFSLLTALLLLTIVGVAIVLVQLWREVGPLRAEVRRLRDEVGYLPVDDPGKLQAIQVDTGEELLWKWRVWLPENRVYLVRERSEEIPKDGFPPEHGSIGIRDPGEHVITYRITRDPRNGQWYGNLHAASGGTGKDAHPWVEWPSRTSSGGGVGGTTRTFEPDERVELIRLRVSQASNSSMIEDPSAGFMIWLEPSK
jgi:hypothetical protein